MSVHWSLKWSIFAASVVSLSWFFAGWRQVNQAGGIGDWALLVGGTASTICLLGLQGYWIYFEEKNKGRLTKRIGLFESIHEKLEARRSINIEAASTKSETGSTKLDKTESTNSKTTSDQAQTAKKERE